MACDIPGSRLCAADRRRSSVQNVTPDITSSISARPSSAFRDPSAAAGAEANQTATTTNTFLTTTLYELDGFPAGVQATPAPPALLLTLTGLIGAALHLAWRRPVRSS